MRRKLLISFILIVLLLCMAETAEGSAQKWFRFSRYQDWVVDSGVLSMPYYKGLYRYTWGRGNYGLRNYMICVKGWTDTAGTVYDYANAGTHVRRANEEFNTMPLPDENGLTIHRYLRWQPPKVVVDGDNYEEPFPRDAADEVAPEKIPGTAYQMVESTIRTHLGITIKQRVLGWTQHHHDDFLIYDYTLINTGNVDLDEDIELPDQSFDSLYFGQVCRMTPSRYWFGWFSAEGQEPGDSLRFLYSYAGWQEARDYDDLGWPDLTTGFLENPLFPAMAVLHADSSANNQADNRSLPHVTDYIGTGKISSSFFEMDETGRYEAFEAMARGWATKDGLPLRQDRGLAAYPGTYHMVPHDQFGYKYPLAPPWVGWSSHSYYACGPYSLQPGDSIRIVWAAVVGCISRKTGWNIGQDWLNGVCTWPGPGSFANLDNMPPPVDSNPELVPTENDWAKDCYVMSGLDSLRNHVAAAYWSTHNNYNVPVAPPPPTVRVNGKPNFVEVSWGSESEVAPDFAGYRVYRAKGNYRYDESQGIVEGDWEMIFECGAGTPNPLVHRYEDEGALRGVNYYYYVTAFDDGSHPEVPTELQGGFDGEPESLESGKYTNMTSLMPVKLSKPPGEELLDVRVVPNPFNVKAEKLQFPEERKIMFFNLPPICTIRIYNETGDLIQTLEHTDGSGDEAWSDPTNTYYMITSSNQVPVSGLYIANIVTPDGRSTNIKFVIIR